jgi:hypothetical protein
VQKAVELGPALLKKLGAKLLRTGEISGRHGVHALRAADNFVYFICQCTSMVWWNHVLLCEQLWNAADGSGYTR